jgi:hypothetical protein
MSNCFSAPNLGLTLPGLGSRSCQIPRSARSMIKATITMISKDEGDLIKIRGLP